MADKIKQIFIALVALYFQQNQCLNIKNMMYTAYID
jgi:hypothetical protein